MPKSKPRKPSGQGLKRGLPHGPKDTSAKARKPGGEGTKRPSTSHIVGLDLSKRRTGVALRGWEELATCFTMSVGDETPYYLAHANFALELCTRVQPGDLVVVETPVVGHSSAVRDLYSLGAIVRLLLFRRTGLIPIDVHPSTLKKFATGSGKGEKDIVMAHVQKRWGKMFANNDETDAFICAEIGAALCGAVHLPLTKPQQECINKILDTNPHAAEQTTVARAFLT